MQFSRQEHLSRLPFPSLRCFPDPGIKLTSPALAGGSFTTEPPGKSPKQGGFSGSLWTGVGSQGRAELLPAGPFSGPSFCFNGFPSSSPTPSPLPLLPFLADLETASLSSFTLECRELNELPFPRAAAFQKGGLCLTQRNESLMVNFQAN